MNAHLSSLLDKQVSRKEFLGILGLAGASVLGMGSILKLITGRSLDGSANLGYGSSAYGGHKN